MEKEIWKDIPNFEGYQVSSLGRVRTHNKITYTKKHGYRHWKNRILKPKQKDKKKAYRSGYQYDLWKDGKPYRFLVARLTAFTFYNEDINNHKLTVDHLDGNRLNNNIKNLELVSLKENIVRAFNTGLMNKHTFPIKIIDKSENKEYKFRSMAMASIFVNHNKGYISAKIKRNIYENKNYKWERI